MLLRMIAKSAWAYSVCDTADELCHLVSIISITSTGRWAHLPPVLARLLDATVRGMALATTKRGDGGVPHLK